jgi:hypothetical protein
MNLGICSRAQVDPAAAISTYLHFVYREAVSSGYNFNRGKIWTEEQAVRMLCTHGQLMYEWEHLKQKLKQRDRTRYEAAAAVPEP